MHRRVILVRYSRWRLSWLLGYRYDQKTHLMRRVKRVHGILQESIFFYDDTGISLSEIDRIRLLVRGCITLKLE